MQTNLLTNEIRFANKKKGVATNSAKSGLNKTQTTKLRAIKKTKKNKNASTESKSWPADLQDQSTCMLRQKRNANLKVTVMTD